MKDVFIMQKNKKNDSYIKPLILQISENKEELLTCSKKKVHWHNQVCVINLWTFIMSWNMFSFNCFFFKKNSSKFLIDLRLFYFNINCKVKQYDFHIKRNGKEIRYFLIFNKNVEEFAWQSNFVVFMGDSFRFYVKN